MGEKILCKFKWGWQKILKLTLNSFGGERCFSLQNFKLLEISYKLVNPFWKDVFYALHLSKPHVKNELKECLSLDILNFIPTEDFPLYNRWDEAGIQNLCHIVDFHKRDFLTFEQIKQRVQTNNFMRYYILISNIPMEIKKCIRDNTDINFTANFTIKDIFLEKLTFSKNIRFIYDNIIERHVYPPVEKFAKWEKELHTSIEDFKKYFCMLQKCCRDTYLYNFNTSSYIGLFQPILFYLKLKSKTQNCALSVDVKRKLLDIYFMTVK